MSAPRRWRAAAAALGALREVGHPRPVRSSPAPCGCSSSCSHGAWSSLSIGVRARVRVRVRVRVRIRVTMVKARTVASTGHMVVARRTAGKDTAVTVQLLTVSSY